VNEVMASGNQPENQLITPDAFSHEIARADNVIDLKSLVDKGSALVKYMRDAGHYDVPTVRKFQIGMCEAVVKAGRLLEKIAPRERERTDLTAETDFGSYKTEIERANLKERTALNWRAAGKLDDKKRQEWYTKIEKKDDIPKLTDLYRMGRPAQKRESIGAAAELTGSYPIIYADPPWKYEHPAMGATSRSIENHYPTMTLAEIKAVKVPAAEDSVLLLWATAPKLPECLEVMETWGFQYRTNSVWDKEIIGTGYYFRNQHELLLVGRRGNLPVPEPGTQPSSIFKARRTEHSVKPVKAYEIIEQLYPDFSEQWFEMFLRGKARDGWAGGWGNEAEAG
jgi:N6-adenosine-specific RNA methylase IME4